MPSWIGPWEIAIVVIIALLIFGPKKLPDLGSSLGKSIRGFKQGMKEGQDELSKAVAEVKEAGNDAPVTKTTTAEAPSSAEATVTTAAAAATTTSSATATAELPKCWGTYESGHEACLQCSASERCAEASVSEPPVS
jgi:sec-independent protein translocase protein TatA